jgi:hypothetical protein
MATATARESGAGLDLFSLPYISLPCVWAFGTLPSDPQTGPSGPDWLHEITVASLFSEPGTSSHLLPFPWD